MPPFAKMSYAKSKDFKKAMLYLFKSLKPYRIAVIFFVVLGSNRHRAFHHGPICFKFDDGRSFAHSYEL